MKFETYVTIKSGAECQISGDREAINKVEVALKAAGFKWNKQVETWDEGFYDSTPLAKSAGRPLNTD